MNPTALCPSPLPLTKICGVLFGSREGNKELNFSSQLTVPPLIWLSGANLDLHWLKTNVNQEIGV